eukprot:TRINITY_DN8806_c0_g1_i3.p1 TRINITY_DN8806_c0_g1~~TRINITY_DN8806_c0_g1_i3.p1  ORF type:complete len:220 (-),score=9.18 TRINITY_DN8806_c0_g1_i3:54-713(-)
MPFSITCSLWQVCLQAGVICSTENMLVAVGSCPCFLVSPNTGSSVAMTASPTPGEAISPDERGRVPRSRLPRPFRAAGGRRAGRASGRPVPLDIDRFAADVRRRAALVHRNGTMLSISSLPSHLTHTTGSSTLNGSHSGVGQASNAPTPDLSTPQTSRSSASRMSIPSLPGLLGPRGSDSFLSPQDAHRARRQSLVPVMGLESEAFEIIGPSDLPIPTT